MSNNDKTVETRIWEALEREHGKDLIAEELLDICERERQRIIDWVNGNIKGGGNYSGKFVPAWRAFLKEQGGRMNIDEAIEKYKKNVSLAPNKSWTHNSLGNAYLLNGKYDEAIAEFNMALTINPDSKYAKEKLEEINEKRTNK